MALISLSLAVLFAEKAAANPFMPLAARCKDWGEQNGCKSAISVMSFFSSIKLLICAIALEYALRVEMYLASPKITVSVFGFWL